MNLYNLKQLEPNKFLLAKFDSDFNVAAIYNLEPHRGDWSCDCPANLRTVVLKKCKHRRMMPLMLGACNTDRFFDPDTGNWLQPLGDIDRPQAKPPIGETLADVPMGALSPTEGAVMDLLVGEAPSSELGIPTEAKAVDGADASEQRCYNQSLDGAIESGMIKIVPEPALPSPAPSGIRRR